MPEKTSTRLNKYISESGVCSRREADRYIEQGNVQINGKRAQIGAQVFPGDKVMVNGQIIEAGDSRDTILLAFNKPVGITSTTEAGVKDNIVDYVNHSERVFPIGRLDKDSQGLIFLTNNGDIVNKILRAGNKHEKEYIVTVNRPVTDEFVEEMMRGVPIMGDVTKKCVVMKEAPFVFRIILVQGLNRQIRKMCEYFGYEVTKLERIRIMNVNVKGIPLGDWRELTEVELKGIYKAIEKSSSTVAPREKPKEKPKPAKKYADDWLDDSPKKKSSGGSSSMPAKAKPYSKRSRPDAAKSKSRSSGAPKSPGKRGGAKPGPGGGGRKGRGRR